MDPLSEAGTSYQTASQIAVRYLLECSEPFREYPQELAEDPADSNFTSECRGDCDPCTSNIWNILAWGGSDPYELTN